MSKWTKFRNKATDYLITKGGELAMKTFWNWISRTAVKVFRSFKKIITGNMAKIQIKKIWDKYDDFEDFWKEYAEFVNKI